MSMLGWSKAAKLRKQDALRGCFLLGAVALGLQPGKGADYPRYDQWVKAFSSYDVLQLKSTTLSPVGVPVSHWSHAPALVTNALDRVLELLPFVETGLHTVSWLVSLALWWALIGLARLASRGDSVLMLLMVAAAFVGTHMGFYSVHHSSEIFALASFTVAAYWAVSAGPERARDSLVIGIACGLLLAIRVNLLMYLPLPLAARAFVLWRARRDTPRRPSWLHALALGVPLLAFAAQLAVFNYWMTGSPTRSPYMFGDDGFRSVDFTRPLLGTTLFHSWHGLLTYHPLFALGAVALAALAFTRRLALAERLFAALALFSLLAHFYLQASWWCWWLGTGTFGNRTLALGGVFSIVALTRWLSLLLDAEAGRARRYAGFALLASITAACIWSFLLYQQGQSNYHSWKELLHGQRVALRSSVLVPLGFAATFAIATVLVALRRARRDAVLLGITGFVGALGLCALWASPLRHWCARQGLEPFVTPLLGLLSAAAVAIVVRAATDATEIPATQRARTLVAGALCWIFVAGGWSFVKLANAAGDVIANGKASARDYKFRSTFVVEDVVDSVREYEAVAGFEKRKLAAKHFIDRVVAEESTKPPKKKRRPRRKR